jgi:biopolymer transport protein TolR
MAMDVGGAKGGIKSDINVTPLVDVMLVLLIIMMLIAPLLQKGVELTLPNARNTAEKPDTSDQTTVFVDAQSKLYINAIEMSESALIARLTDILSDKADKVVYLKGDKDAPYGAIMKMMDALRGAKIDSVALIAEKPGGNLGQMMSGQGGQ